MRFTGPNAVPYYAVGSIQDAKVVEEDQVTLCKRVLLDNWEKLASSYHETWQIQNCGLVTRVGTLASATVRTRLFANRT